MQLEKDLHGSTTLCLKTDEMCDIESLEDSEWILAEEDDKERLLTPREPIGIIQ